ncbi:MAG: ATP-binding cassette domain-containing protein [Atribacterota bacterium]
MQTVVQPILEMRGITKNFGGLRALDKVDFELRQGEVMGLVGDNGAGKTTLIKILTGVYPPDEGEIILEGKPVKFRNRQHAKSLGIEAVYQDLALVETLNAPANVYLGSEISHRVFGFSILDNNRMKRDALQLLRTKLNIVIDKPEEAVFNLSGGQKQSVAIGRAILKENIKILVMDEPTAALGPEETEKTFQLIRTLRDQGLALVVISHNLEHIFNVCDRITVLRRGKMVGVREVALSSKTEILGLIVGVEKPANEK